MKTCISVVNPSSLSSVTPQKKNNAVFRFVGSFALFAVVLFCHSVQAQQTLPWTEHFPWPEGERLGLNGSSSNVWNIGNSTGTDSATNTSVAALSSPGLAASSGNGLRIKNSPSSSRNRGATFTTQTLSAGNPTVYASFLLNIQAAPSGLRPLISLSPATTGASGPSTAMTLFVNSSGNLQLGKNSTSAATATLAPALSAGTHFIVIRYK